ncbi:MAG: hypothetical protein FRX49_03159 [Trebouxia sp. A1-2]|nr:MAG: hypothetical protein FRX49_03159 [Trebouxia sp. A1-2]
MKEQRPGKGALLEEVGSCTASLRASLASDRAPTSANPAPASSEFTCTRDQGLLHQQRRPFCLCCAAYFQFEPELAVPVPDVSGDESAVEGLAAAAVEGETPEVPQAG